MKELSKNIKKIITLTGLFFKIAIKQKTTPLFFIVAILSIAISSSISGIDIGDKADRLFIDITIFIQSSILTLIAIFFSLNYLEKERSGGIFIIPLSSGVNRKLYFISLILSQITILFTIFAIFFGVDVIYISLFQIDSILIYQLFLSFLSSIVLATLMIMIGEYTTPLKGLVYTIIIYFIGNGLDELYLYSYQLKSDEVLQILYEILSKIVPNFYIFGETKISIYPFFHTVTQILILSILGYLKFKNRVLKVEN